MSHIREGQEHHEHQRIILIDADTGEIIRGGIVVDEAVALNTPCHGFKIELNGKTSELVFSKGIVGALSEDEKVKYCKLGIRWEPPPSKLAQRLKFLHQAGIFRK